MDVEIESRSILSSDRLHPLFSLDNLLLLVFTCGVMWVGCTYQKLMAMIYCTE